MAWDSTRNDALMVTLGSFAGQLRELGFAAVRITDNWGANVVADDPAFISARGMAKDDATAIVGLAGDLLLFLQDQPVTTRDRRSDLARALAGPIG